MKEQKKGATGVRGLISIVVLFVLFVCLCNGQQGSWTFNILDSVNWRAGQTSVTSVTETYTYDQSNDKVTVYAQFNTSGLAPLPPMLALARQYGFPVQFIENVIDTGQSSHLGPLLGVNSTNNYTYEVRGLAKYVFYNPTLGSGTIPPALLQELESEVDKVIAAGHLSPPIYLVCAPGAFEHGCPERGHAYWFYPGEQFQYLADVLPLLSTAKQQSLRSYLQSERINYAPEDVRALWYDQGIGRYYCNHSDSLRNAWWTDYNDFRMYGNPKVWNLYGLARYYEVMGEIPDSTVMNKCTAIVNDYFTYHDWASMYFDRNNWPDYNAVDTVNQIYAGLVGYIRLARLANDQNAEALGWGLFVRFAALRYAMAKYTQYEYDTGRFTFPQNDPDWWAQQVQGSWNNELITFNWTLPIHNVRQVHMFDDQGVLAWEYYGWASGGWSKRDWFKSEASYEKMSTYLLPFVDMVPELALFMKDYLKPEVETYFNRVKENQPHWYHVYAESILGNEGNFMVLSDQYGLFLVSAWILDEEPRKLYKYCDVSSLKVGDLYYIHKLGETIKAYMGSAPPVPTKLLVSAIPTVLEANGTSTSQIEAKVCDDNWFLVPDSAAEITFSITGGGGNLVGTNPVNATNGIATITYRSGTQEEIVTVTATSTGLIQGSADISLVINDPPNGPTNLLCNNQDNPVGLADFDPELSWTFSDPDSGDSQTAYRVLVANSQADIDNNNGNMWDTTKVPSSAKNVAYAGAQFTANQTYYWKVMTWDSFDAQGSYSQVATFTMANTDPRAFHGIPMGIPGRIEIEDFDIGGEGVAYHDTTGGNAGDADYRLGESVDISDSRTGGYLVAGNPQGEWVEYTVDVGATDTYTIVVNLGATGLGGTFHIEFDGLDKTGLLQVPDTGSGGCWNRQTISVTGVSLTAGKQIMRLVIDSNHTQWNDYCGCMDYIDVILPGQVTPEITVTSPDGGENWTIGGQETVIWTSVGTIGNVNIDLSIDGGANWTVLVLNTANDGIETVTVPGSLPASTQCRVRVQDIDVTPSDMSDANFTIQTSVVPTITVTSPNGGQAWIIDTQQTVTWTSQGSVGNAVNIDLSTDGGSNWTTLVSNTANDGSETLTVPSSPSVACRIRVADISGPSGPSDMSNNNFTISAEGNPIISINPDALEFGKVEIGKTAEMDFVITNTGGGTLSGTITDDKKWIEVEPTSFSGNSVAISVTVDNSILNQQEGEYTGIISIISNGGNTSVEVTLVATCVLVKPNPYDPSKGNLTFFGDGIVPGETTIRIYTLNGELIKTLGEMRSEVERSEIPSGAESRLSGEIIWDGKNEDGKEIANGIYIYIYESPNEKGVGKFTVINK